MNSDNQGFITSGEPKGEPEKDDSKVDQLLDDVAGIRDALESPSEPQQVTRPASPRLGAPAATAKPVTPKDLIDSAKPVVTSKASPMVVQVVYKPAAKPELRAPERTNRQQADRSEVSRPKANEIRVLGSSAPASTPQPSRPEAKAPVSTASTGNTASTGSTGNTTAGDAAIEALSSIKDAIGSATHASENIDPAIKAGQEVAQVAGGALSGIKTVGGALGQIAMPVIRGMQKPNDAPTPWFRRFFRQLRGLRREESVFNRAQLRTLKAIEAKPVGGKRGGIGGLLMMLIGPLVAAIGAAMSAGFGLLGKIPGLGVLGKLAGAMTPSVPITRPTTTVPTTTVPGSTAGGAAGGPAKKPGALARAAGGIGGALKRVPLLGAALAAVGVGAAIYGNEREDNSARAEKDKNTGKAAGVVGGTLSGMAAGGWAGAKLGALAGAVAGPAGSAIGLALGGLVGALAGGFFGEKAGSIIGETLGGWVTEMRNADIPGMIGRTWASTTGTMAQAWTETAKWFEAKWDVSLVSFGAVWDKAKGVFGDLSLGLTKLLEKLGLDLPAIAQALEDAKQKVGAVVTAAKDKVVQGATAALSYGREKLNQAGEALADSHVGRGIGVLSSGIKNVFDRADGSKEVRDGGTKAWRNNNPGNLRMSEFSRANGAIGQDRDGFAIFPSVEIGAAAKEKLIFTGKNYKDKTLSETIARYAPKNENDTGLYQRTILQSVGGVDKRMTDYTPTERAAILAAMGRMEGYSPGKTTVLPAQGGQAVAEPKAQAAPAATPATPAAPAIAPLPAVASVTAGARTIPQMPQTAAVPPRVPELQTFTKGLANTMAGGKEQRPSVVRVNPLAAREIERPMAHIVVGGLVSENGAR